MSVYTLGSGEFQSTLPVGGATVAAAADTLIPSNFNPRSPWGERRSILVNCRIFSGISIHAPRGGSDAVYLRC